MRTRTVLAAALAIAGMVAVESNASAAWRWPWEKANNATPTPKAAATLPLPAPTATPAAQAQTPATNADQQFVLRVHDLDQQLIAMATAVQPRITDASVKSFASSLIANHQRIEATMRARGQAIGFALSPINVSAGSAAINSAADPEVAFLEQTLSTIDSALPWEASYKENEGNRGFHAQLVEVFDTLKTERKQAHDLRDRVHTQRVNVKGRTPKATPIPTPFRPNLHLPTTTQHESGK